MTEPNAHRASIAVLIPAAGHGQRFGAAENKLHALLAGKPIWQHAIEAFINCPQVGKIVLAVSPRDKVLIEKSLSQLPYEVELVIGGEARSDSVAAMLEHLDLWNQTQNKGTPVQWVAIHDAARPLLTESDRDKVFDAAIETGAAFLGVPVTDSLHRRAEEGTVSVSRESLFAATTPQVFKLQTFVDAHQQHGGQTRTDDVALVQQSGVRVDVVIGRSDNLKITFAEDLVIAEAILTNRRNSKPLEQS